MTSEKDISISISEPLKKMKTKGKIVKETTKQNIEKCNQCKKKSYF